MKRLLARCLIAFAALVALYGLVSYLVLPDAWSIWNRGRAPAAMLTRTADGLPGDPINLAIVGDEAALVAAMSGAGWAPADAITFETSIAIVGSVLFDRPDRDAPVSPLLYDGRRQDFAFEKTAGQSADRRQHVRFWRSGEREGRPLTLGAVTFDAGVGVSHYTGEVTHRIAPDIDAARESLVDALMATGRVSEKGFIDGRGATADGRNGEGDLYWTDGQAALLVLKP